MASQQTAPPAESSLSAQVVGNTFVHQYYHILHQSPELVHRFYQDGSKLGRPEPQGSMSSVTTMQAINEKILSMDYNDRKEIKTVDAQESLDGGVLVLVTGYLTGKDDVRRDFAQSFFLASQDKGYFVLNDIFRFMEEADHQQGNQVLANGTSATPLLNHETPPQEQQLPERSVSPPEEEEDVNEEEAYNPSDHEEVSVVEEQAPVKKEINEVSNSPPPVVADSGSRAVQGEAPKKSYASIVKVMKENPAPLSVPAAVPSRPAHANHERQVALAPTPAPAAEVPAATSNATEISSVQEAEVDGHSIYIKSLPLNATPAQLEEEFKRFGPIKPGGVQVRSHKQQGFCFGFVEFEVVSAVQSAIEASPVMIGGRQAHVEEKRPAGSRVPTRGRFLPGRGGGFRSDGVRGGRGNYGGGRGGYSYGRGDYGNRADFGSRGGGRAGGSSNHGGDVGYQRVDHVGSTGGRGNRGTTAPNASSQDVAPRVPATA